MKNQVVGLLIFGVTFFSAAVQAMDGVVSFSGTKSLTDSANNCMVQLIHDTLLKFEGQDFAITEPTYGMIDHLQIRSAVDLSHAEVHFVAANKANGAVFKGVFVAHIKSKVNADYMAMRLNGWDVSCWSAATKNSCHVDDINYSLSNIHDEIVVQRLQFHACTK